MGKLRQAFRYFFRRSKHDADVRREMNFHLQSEIDQRIRNGMSVAEARRTALRDFGSVTRTSEEIMDARGMTFWDQLVQDTRFGVRTLRRSPGFTLAAMLILALGIGANTAIFSVIDGVLIKPLPFPDSERLVLLQQSAPQSNIQSAGIAIPELQDYRERLRSVTDLVEYHQMNFTLLKQGEPDRVQVGVVSSNFFDVLGVSPVLGRTFNADDEKVGADAVLLLSHEYWQSKFGGDTRVVGRVLEMNNRPHTVVGVLPSFPQYPQPNDLYMPPPACPFRADAQQQLPQGHRTFPMNVYGRLAPGVTEAQASSEVAGIASAFPVNFAREYARAKGFTGGVSSLQDQLVVGARPMLWALAGTTVLVLLITCANVANLSLARTVRRSREMGVRTALGASRGRLFRQLVTESVIVALGGGLAGVAFAWASLGMLTSFVGRFTPWTSQIAIDGGVLAFTAATAILTGMVFGTIPALAARRGLVDAVRDGGAQAGESRGRHRMRSALVVAQVAVAFVLVVSATLLLESLRRRAGIELGYDTRQVMSADIAGNFSKVRNLPLFREIQKGVLEKLRATPGVKSAAITNVVPLSNIVPGQVPIEIEGITSQTTSLLVDPNVASDGYFETIGVSLLAGRSFTESDNESAQQVVVINASMAKLWGEISPLGRRFRNPPPQATPQQQDNWFTVIGIVPDFYLYGGEAGMQPQYYRSFRQSGGGGRVIARTNGDPGTLPALIRNAVFAVDDQVPVEDLATVEQLKTGRLASPALTAALLSTFAGVALLVTLAGLAGVIGTTVSQRTQEFGLRMALGASRISVIRLVLRQGAVMVLIGIGLGIGGAWAFGRLLQTQLPLFATTATDPLAYVIVALVFLAASVISIAGPARRATTIDPLSALRIE